jgi:hypothetical protein
MGRVDSIQATQVPSRVAEAMTTPVSTAAHKKPPWYMPAMPSCVSAMAQMSVAKAAVPAKFSTSSLAAELGRSFQGFHPAARADPASKPIKCVSVPRYTRLGSPPSICVTYSQAIHAVLATAMQPAATPKPVLPVLFSSHKASNGHSR